MTGNLLSSFFFFLEGGVSPAAYLSSKKKAETTTHLSRASIWPRFSSAASSAKRSSSFIFIRSAALAARDFLARRADPWAMIGNDQAYLEWNHQCHYFVCRWRIEEGSLRFSPAPQQPSSSEPRLPFRCIDCDGHLKKRCIPFGLGFHPGKRRAEKRKGFATSCGAFQQGIGWCIQGFNDLQY